ncbi:tyrosine-type recombinase/integrase [Enterococcus sp. LJL98]
MAKTQYLNVYTDNKGQFYYEVSLGTDRITGKRNKAKSRTFSNGVKFRTAHEAFIEVTRVKNEYFQNTGISNRQINYEQFITQHYLPAYETEVRNATFESRKSIIENLIQRFGKKKLKDITITDAQNFKTWLLAKKGANYSQSYASLTYGTFKKTLEFAVDMQYLTTNIASKINGIPKGKTNVDFWTKQDFEQVISQIYISDYYEHLNFVMLWVYFNTGIRVNEGCALWWEDVDFKKKELRVNHMLQLKSKTNWVRQDYTKTESGNRTVSLDNDTIEILKQWKERQSEANIDDTFIFSHDGHPMIKSTIGRIIKRYAQLADVPKIQAKGLRHSHASYLINELNVNVLILSKRLGHSSPEITLKHYAHLWPGVDKEIAVEMTGKIKINTSEKKRFQFNGNQAVKSSTVSKTVSK